MNHEHIYSPDPKRASQDRLFPHLYWISDENISQEIIQSLGQSNIKFGLEVGFGTQLTDYTKIDPKIKYWVAAEKNSSSFIAAQDYLDYKKYWDPDSQKHGQTVYAIQKEITVEDLKRPDVLIYRNPNIITPESYNFNKTPFPTFNQLQQGQRLVMIVDNGLWNEVSEYKNELEKLGYHPMFNLQEKHIDIDRGKEIKVYVFEIKKE